jgi:hypothetical protein
VFRLVPVRFLGSPLSATDRSCSRIWKGLFEISAFERLMKQKIPGRVFFVRSKFYKQKNAWDLQNLRIVHSIGPKRFSKQPCLSFRDDSRSVVL